MTKCLKISIVTAVYNREKTIEQAVNSVNEQSYSNVEHLIIDGGSTDDTLKIIRQKNLPRIRVFSEPDTGIYDALNKGIILAKGEVIGIMHSDDFFANSHVIKKVAQAFDDRKVEAVYGDLDYVSSSDPSRIIRHWRSADFNMKRLMRGWMPPHPSLFLRRSVFDRLGLYDTTYKIASDYEAILRYFGKGNIQSIYLPEVLVKMRVGGESNRNLGRIIQKSREDYRALRSNKMGGLTTVAWKNLSKIPQFIVK